MVIKAFDKELYFSVDGTVCVLEEVPTHESKSRNFNFDTPEEKPKKRYVPPMSHPWKRASFEAFLRKQAHRKDITA